MTLLNSILHRNQEEKQAPVWFPRAAVNAEAVEYVMWRSFDGWRTGTILERFEYRGENYVRVTPHTGSITMKALPWSEVAYVL